MRGLYAIVDADFLAAHGVPLLEFAERVVAAHPAAIQLRAKRESARRTLVLIRQIAGWCREEGVPFFANDRPDLAVLGHADGVHVGQEDLAIADVHRFAVALRVGISTHDEAQLAAALAGSPDYVAYGPVYPTTSKDRADAVVGVASLRRAAIACRAARVPLVAIGGIDLDTAPEIAEIAAGGAAIRALLPGSGVEGVSRRAEELHRALGGSHRGARAH